jgi:hypothetical protein
MESIWRNFTVHLSKSLNAEGENPMLYVDGTLVKVVSIAFDEGCQNRTEAALS